MRHLLLALGILAFGLQAVPALAQDLTDDEILRLFEAQRSAFAEAGKSGSGKTRGLTIVTVENLAEVDASVGQTSPDGIAAPEGDRGSDLAEVTIPGSEGGPVLAEAPVLPGEVVTGDTVIQPVSYGSLDKDLQVNVRVQFGYDSATLAEDQKPTLAQMCNVMKDSDIKLFRIVGHTDSVGSDAYNERLSQLRAEEVKRYLTTECGLASDRLEAVGLGKRFLFDSTDPKSPENRRVEFQAVS